MRLPYPVHLEAGEKIVIFEIITDFKPAKMHFPERIAIAFTVNDSYAQHCCVAMVSALENNKSEQLDIYIFTDYFSEKTRQLFEETVKRYGENHRIFFVIVDDSALKGLRLNIEYITHHTYYRFLLPNLLPDLDRILYLDSDLVVDGPLRRLWETPLDGYLSAGVSDTWIEQFNYKYRIGMAKQELYINAGVILMNLDLMRKEQIPDLLMQTALAKGRQLDYQDQDVINLVLRGRIKEVPGIYNHMASDDNSRQGRKPVIIHYNGDVKPWSTQRRCHNPLAPRYFAYLRLTPYRKFRSEFIRSRLLRTLKKAVGINVYPDRIKVGLVIDEYFGACGTPYGGYGFLARNYIARYLPDTNISVEVLLWDWTRRKFAPRALVKKVDNRKVIIPPGRFFVRRWLKKKNYDIYLTVELTHSILKYEQGNKPIIHWIQDPRPWSEWLEIQTVKLLTESCYWSSKLYDSVNEFYRKGLVTFVSQGYFLNKKAIELYRLPDDVPIAYMPNPIDIDYEFDPESYPKKNHILFIGRIESVKRGWLFCEIAKRLPQYEFFMLGQSLQQKAQNERIMANYRDIPNLHFVGHIEGEEKKKYIREAKILVNTSIHEALPITFLEALAYGTLLVSCRNPENLTSKFGRYTGPVLCDGFDKVPLFTNAVEELIENEELRKELSCKAVEYIREVHPVHKFQEHMRRLIHELTHK